MLHRGPVFVGDLKPIGVARHLTVVRRDNPLSAWATISMSCLSAVALLTAGAVWLAPGRVWISPTSTRGAASVVSVQAPSPATFPAGVEVPHLTGPLSTQDDPDALSLADGPRTFLDPNPADTAEQPMLLPPRADPRLPPIGRAPLDGARLTHEQPPVWSGRTERQDRAISASRPLVAALGSDVPPSSLNQAGSAEAQTLPARPAPPAILSSAPAQAPGPTEVTVRPAQAVTVSSPPRRVATLSPNPVRQPIDQAGPIMPPDVRAVTVPVLNPGPARHARSLRRPQAATPISRSHMPYRDAEETASIVSLPRSARARFDAGAVAHASMHRARADHSVAPSTSSEPSTPWTLPPALAPTD